ncbi:hypothetical protein NDU88_009250 [Pleurodeles waltl]|uniref:Uncharacterized protein n=1 Tax=Pleurodeles waltl TaxID=8319 RepID=A0AAV7NYP8_PLEWA|nr:hypothetical protein NDU88_009250 [Pleurodeles waltl]
MWHCRPQPHWAWTEESNAASSAAGDGCDTADHSRTGHGQRKAMQPQALLVTDVTLQTTAVLGMDRGKQCSLMPAGVGCGTADHSRTGHGQRKTMQPHACWCRMWHRRPQPHWAWTEKNNAAACLLVTDVALQTTAALGMDRGKKYSLMPAGDRCDTADHSRTGHGRRKAVQPHACW